MWWCDVEWWCGAWEMWWCAVMQDVKCGCGIPSDVEWFDAILDMVWCRMKCWNAVWDVWCEMCGIVQCAIYIWMWWCAWCGARWNVGVMWNGVPRCGGTIWCELWCDVKCGAMWNAIEMQNVWCGIWRGVDCGVLQGEMLHNARCGKLRDVKCGGVELWWGRMWHMQCAVIIVSFQMWKMMQCVVTRCGGVTM